MRQKKYVTHKVCLGAWKVNPDDLDAGPVLPPHPEDTFLSTDLLQCEKALALNSEKLDSGNLLLESFTIELTFSIIKKK